MNKPALARLIPLKTVCRDVQKLKERLPDTGSVGVNLHDFSGEERASTVDGGSTVNLCAIVSDIASQVVTCVASPTILKADGTAPSDNVLSYSRCSEQLTSARGVSRWE